MFGYKKHVGIRPRARFVRRFKATDAAAHDGAQLGALLDPGNTASAVWADTAYRSAANTEMLEKGGLKRQFQRHKGWPDRCHNRWRVCLRNWWRVCSIISITLNLCILCFES